MCMEFFKVVKERRSIREFKDKPVPADKLRKILAAAKAAPSAGNLQSYDVVVVKKPKTIASLASAMGYHQDSLAKAPLMLVFFANQQRSAKDFGRRGVELYCIQDATIACAYAQLAARAVGLASVWVGAFEPGLVRGTLKAPGNAIPVAILPVGYAAEKPRAGKRVDRTKKEGF